MRTINVTLSLDGIEKAIKELNDYAKEVEQKTKLLVSNLTDLGADIARVKIVSLGAIYSGELLSSVSAFMSPLANTGFVRVTNDHAAFIEFGTGPVGASSSHPSGEGTYKSTGWFTQADGKDMATMYGWIPIELSDGNVIYYTMGQPAKPFMYQTALEIQREFPRIAQEVFSR